MRPLRTAAIAIGVDRAPGLSRLHNAENDARGISELLAGVQGPVDGADVFCVLGRYATRPILREVFREVRFRQPDLLFVGFSGHGSENSLYLADGPLSHQQFAHTINQVGARRAAIVIDACHAAAFAAQYGFTELGGLPDDGWQLAFARMLPGVRLLVAARPNEYASDGTGRNGAFTGALLKVLRAHNGNLRIGNQRFVSAEAAFRLAALMVHKQSRGAQSPRAFGPVADFPLVRALARRAAPARW